MKIQYGKAFLFPQGIDRIGMDNNLGLHSTYELDDNKCSGIVSVVIYRISMD